MSPAVKYTLGRLGLFLVVLLVLWPVNMNLFLKLMVAVIFSAAASFFLLRGWRDEMAQQMADSMQRRQAEKERLRAALAGDDIVPRDAGAPPAGDRPDTDGPDPTVGPSDRR